MNKSESNLSSLEEISPLKNVARCLLPFSIYKPTFNDFEKYSHLNLGQMLHDSLMRGDISEKERVEVEAVMIKYIEFLEGKNFELTNN